jgi:hypothetical protein
LVLPLSFIPLFLFEKTFESQGAGRSTAPSSGISDSWRGAWQFRIPSPRDTRI